MGVDLAVSGWGILIAGAALAGWIDAVIGGGGLVLIPLILAVMPQLAPVTALAVNKVAAVTGTASAAVTLVRRVRPPTRLLLLYIPVALVCSGAGALAASSLDKQVMRPLIIVLMLVVGLVVVFKPSFGTGESSTLPRGWRLWVALGAVGLIAGYDGIFGPGTGMFLIMAFTALLSQNFLTSAAMAKVVNTSTNAGALIIFISGGHVWWQLALVLAVANVLGAQLGARTVLGGGTKLIRYALLALVIVMCSYLGWQQYHRI